MSVLGTIIGVLHVASAVFIVGPMGVLPHTGLRAMRSGDAGQVRSLARSVSLFTLLSLITFVLGFAAMGLEPKKYDVSFSDTWIWLSVVLYVIALLLSYYVVVPGLKAAAVEVEENPSVGKPSAYGRVVGSAGVTTLLLVAIVVLMVWKP